MTDEMPEQKGDSDVPAGTVERQLAAERRGWVCEVVSGAGPPTEGQRIRAAQATLLDVPEDEEHRGTHFVGEGDGPLGDLLDKIEAFDREHGRGV